MSPWLLAMLYALGCVVLARVLWRRTRELAAAEIELCQRMRAHRDEMENGTAYDDVCETNWL